MDIRQLVQALGKSPFGEKKDKEDVGQRIIYRHRETGYFIRYAHIKTLYNKYREGLIPKDYKINIIVQSPTQYFEPLQQPLTYSCEILEIPFNKDWDMEIIPLIDREEIIHLQERLRHDNGSYYLMDLLNSCIWEADKLKAESERQEILVNTEVECDVQSWR